MLTRAKPMKKINNVIPKLAITDSSMVAVAGNLLCVDFYMVQQHFQLSFVQSNFLIFNKTIRKNKKKKEINSFSFKLC